MVIQSFHTMMSMHTLIIECDLTDVLDYSDTANILVKASSCVLGSIMSNYKNVKGQDYYTYKKLYHTCVCTGTDYSSAIWLYKNYDKCNIIHNRAMRAFLGVRKYAFVPGIFRDIAWKSPTVRHTIEVIRHWIRSESMNINKVTKRIYMYGTVILYRTVDLIM